MGDTYGKSHNLGYFLACPRRVVVVRDPWDRLMSVYHGMAKSQKFLTYGIPSGCTLTQFIEWLVEQDPYECDVHVAPMWAQLKGYFVPRDDELITLEAFLENPPYNLPRVKVHHNKTNYPEEASVITDDLYNAWLNWGGRDDLVLYHRAEKSPLVTGGKQATDDSHEN